MTDRKGRSRTEKERQKMNVSTGINKFQEITMTPNRKKKSRGSKGRAMAVSYEQVTNFKIPFQQEEQSWQLHKRLCKIETDSNLSNGTSLITKY
jgi:hypothetical protein